MFKTILPLVLGIGIVGAAVPVFAKNSGSYLAGRHALVQHDYEKAADYFTRALSLDARNTDLMEQALNAQVSLGRFDRAYPVKRRMESAGHTSPMFQLVRLVEYIENDDFEGLVEAFDNGLTIVGILDDLVEPWVAVGNGNLNAGMEAFDQVSRQSGLRELALYHKSVALAVSGDMARADAVLSGEENGAFPLFAQGVLAHAQVLSQLGRNEEAAELMVRAFGPSPGAPVAADLLARLQNGDRVAFTVASDVRTGIAEVFYTVAQLLYGELQSHRVLPYARTANALGPSNVSGLLLTAALLEQLQQFDLATEVYDQVPRDHPSFLEAEFGRADALRFSNRVDAAVEVLQQLTETYPDRVEVYRALGETLSREDQWADAQAAYDAAVALVDEPRAQDWSLYYARAITLERQGNWPPAEADFRKALELQPNQPQVLNYLGYSLVEKRRNLDEALDMIQRAVAAEPDAGYIVDSLAWVLYRLGRYEEALPHMIRAAELMPVDPVVNDHLGDVFWAVGREREAEFQWHRALSFIDPDKPNPDIDADRVRRKLDVGLDVVLEEEGAEPLVPTSND
ncbi:MAG: tetratricopeptide repeat protein [Pseudomonadota bacterium]